MNACVQKGARKMWVPPPSSLLDIFCSEFKKWSSNRTCCQSLNVLKECACRLVYTRIPTYQGLAVPSSAKGSGRCPQHLHSCFCALGQLEGSVDTSFGQEKESGFRTRKKGRGRAARRTPTRLQVVASSSRKRVRPGERGSGACLQRWELPPTLTGA